MKLTAAQKARLDDLTARESELTDGERAEMTFLAGLEVPEASAEASAEESAEITPEETPAVEESAEETPATKPSIFTRAAAVLKSRENLSADLATVRNELASANETITRLTAENEDLSMRAAAGEAFATRVAELESERATVSQSAARIAASSHVSPDDLPETSDDIETLDTVRTQIAAETDPKKRSILAKRARELRQSAPLN